MGVYGSRQIEFRFSDAHGGLLVHLGNATSMFLPIEQLRQYPAVEIAEGQRIILTVNIDKDAMGRGRLVEKHRAEDRLPNREFTRHAPENTYSWLRYTMVEGRHPITVEVV